MTKYNRYRQAAACGCLNPAERGTLGAGAARGGAASSGGDRGYQMAAPRPSVIGISQ